mmetsp:Transcript_3548/g.6216  ORF Transcript_3548/g.6216 Transcript_3548/m.6216 type:complete len:417 (-) Transcript_3548:70-1320(-)
MKPILPEPTGGSLSDILTKRSCWLLVVVETMPPACCWLVLLFIEDGPIVVDLAAELDISSPSFDCSYFLLLVSLFGLVVFSDFAPSFGLSFSETAFAVPSSSVVSSPIFSLFPLVDSESTFSFPPSFNFSAGEISSFDSSFSPFFSDSPFSFPPSFDSPAREISSFDSPFSIDGSSISSPFFPPSSLVDSGSTFSFPPSFSFSAREMSSFDSFFSIGVSSILLSSSSPFPLFDSESPFSFPSSSFGFSARGIVSFDSSFSIDGSSDPSSVFFSLPSPSGCFCSSFLFSLGGPSFSAVSPPTSSDDDNDESTVIFTVASSSISLSSLSPSFLSSFLSSLSFLISLSPSSKIISTLSFLVFFSSLASLSSFVVNADAPPSPPSPAAAAAAAAGTLTNFGIFSCDAGNNCILVSCIFVA